MSSWAQSLASAFLKVAVKRQLTKHPTAARIRATLNRLPLFGSLHGVARTADRVHDIPGEVLRPRGRRILALVLFVHGGGFVALSAKRYRAITATLARSGFEVRVPDYRLAPEHPFPAALDDLFDCYQAYASQDEPLVVVGDSAGGGLAVSLLLRANRVGLRRPVCVVLLSPWIDLALRSPSLKTNATRCAVLTEEGLAAAAHAYLGDTEPTSPDASPIYGDLSPLPPMLIHVGDGEVLLDDAVRLALAAREAGVSVRLERLSNAPHGVQLFNPFVPKARASLKDAVTFINAQLQGPAHGQQSAA